ncbi:hypothetical protein [Oceanobacillus sp. FSL W7-1293]|uniref:DUF6944 family repetitive protein n=1 Tax=unclassified Oceanobacillus TaxID=2630292 RepID=UPI0030D50D15
MDNNLKVLFGSWEAAIGALLSAIASTPSFKLNETQQTNLDLAGNVMQATGSALAADSEKKLTLNKIGNQVQAMGNSIVISGIVIPFTEETKRKVTIKGNLFQAAGSSMALPDLLDTAEITMDTLYEIYGALLQSIGNALQGLSGIIELKGERGEHIDFVGSWIQTIGAFIQALVQSKTSCIDYEKSFSGMHIWRD